MKIIVIELLVMSCFLFTACSQNDVEEALEVGYWETSWYAAAAGIQCFSIYEFDDGKVIHSFDGANSYIEQGEYDVGNNNIQITWEDGEKEILKYSYKDEQLEITDEYGNQEYENFN